MSQRLLGNILLYFTTCTTPSSPPSITTAHPSSGTGWSGSRTPHDHPRVPNQNRTGYFWRFVVRCSVSKRRKEVGKDSEERVDVRHQFHLYRRVRIRRVVSKIISGKLSAYIQNLRKTQFEQTNDSEVTSYEMKVSLWDLSRVRWAVT